MKDEKQSHCNGWPTQKKMMVSLRWVTYPERKKNDGLIIMGDLPKERWSHYDGRPTQRKKRKKNDGLIIMGDLPKERWSHYDGWPTQMKMMVSLWWVTCPNGKKMNGLIMMGDLPRKDDSLIMMGDLPRWNVGLLVMGDLPRKRCWSHYDGWPTQMERKVVSLLWVTYPDARQKAVLL